MLCYSTGSLPDCSTSDIVSILKSTPFRGIEWVLKPRHLSLSKEDWQKVYRELDSHKLGIRNIHLGFPLLLSDIPHEPGLGNPDADLRGHRIEAAKTAIDIAQHLHCPHVTLTAGVHNENEDLKIQENRVYESIETIIRYKPAHLTLGLEQEPEHIIHSTRQLLEICAHFKGELGVNFDIGHAEVLKENIITSISLLSKYIYNIHFEDIKDNKHKHLLFGEGDIDFNALFTHLKKFGYQGDLTPDLYPFCEAPEEAILSSVSLFEKYW